MTEPNSLDAELSDQLAGLRRQFARGLPKRFDAIATALDACRTDPSHETPLRALMTVLHSLGGAAGIFGFAELGNQAKQAELRVSDWIRSGNGDAQGLAQLATQLDAWRKQA